MSACGSALPLRGAALAFALIWLSPAHAWALPGPEVLVPLGIGVAQLALLLGWLGHELFRRARSALLRMGVVILLLGVGIWGLGELATLVVIATALLAGTGQRRWVTLSLLALLCLGIVTADLWRTDHAVPPLETWREASPPVELDGLGLPAAIASPAHLIHVGEREDFDNCRVDRGSFLRASDLVDRAPALRRSQGPIVLVEGPRTTWLQSETALRALIGPLHIVRMQSDIPGTALACFGDVGRERIGESRYLPRSPDLVPNTPVHYGAPLLRPRDITALRHQHPQRVVLQLRNVLLRSSAELREYAGQEILLVGRPPSSLAAAARLLREADARVVALALWPRELDGQQPALEGPGASWSYLRFLLVVLLTGMLAYALVVLSRWGALRMGVAVARRRAPGFLPDAMRTFGELLLLAAAAAGACFLDRMPVPPEHALWVAPTHVGRSAIGATLAWLAVLGAVLALRQRGRRGSATLILPALFGVLALWTLRSNVTIGGVLPLHGGVLTGTVVWATALERAGLAWLRRQRHAFGLGLPLCDEVPDAGNKSATLARLARRGAPVPPGVVVWGTSPATLRALRLQLGAGPYLVRSSAADEDLATQTRAGAYLSLHCEAPALSESIERVLASYGQRVGRAAALVMPLLPCDLAGAAEISVSGSAAIRIEAAPDRDGVTSGRSVSRHHIGALSRRTLDDFPEALEALRPLLRSEGTPRYIEWLLQGRRAWLVQSRSAEHGQGGGHSVLECLAQLPRGRDPARPLLRRVAGDALPSPASEETLALWCEQWQRESALGDAVAALGIPRWLAPRHTVVGLWGGLYEVIDATTFLARLVALRIEAAARLQRRTTNDVAATLARRALEETETLRQTVAASILLRLIDPYLTDGPEGPSRAPSRAPTLELADALRAGDALDSRWGHRGEWDLDPAAARYAALADAPPAWPTALLPKCCDRASAEWGRDWLHDRMAYFIARLRADTPSWRSLPAPPGPAPPEGTLSLLDAERVGAVAVDASSEAGIWVSGAGPIEGIAERDPEAAAPTRVLIVDAPTPSVAAHFSAFGAVVTRQGGALSHAALVARDDRVPALFGVKGLDLDGLQGRRIRLEPSGEITLLDDALSQR